MASATKQGDEKKAPQLGVYYRSLTVENVRCFADVDLTELEIKPFDGKSL